MNSAKKKLFDPHRKHCFQLFGFDFIMDINCNLHLIEVNNNPCLEESNDYLSQMFPRMLDDMFALTLDQLFSPQ
jgi:hypothetical protein